MPVFRVHIACTRLQWPLCSSFTDFAKLVGTLGQWFRGMSRAKRRSTMSHIASIAFVQGTHESLKVDLQLSFCVLHHEHQRAECQPSANGERSTEQTFGKIHCKTDLLFSGLAIPSFGPLP